MKQTKIVASISDRRCDVSFIRSLFEAGMNVVRMNTAHANEEGIKQIINKIAEETGVAKRDVAMSVEAFMEEIRVSLADNRENVYLRGFGTFVVKRRAKKTARNISKNTTIVIDAHDFPAFKPSKSFIEKMK